MVRRARVQFSISGSGFGFSAAVGRLVDPDTLELQPGVNLARELGAELDTFFDPPDAVDLSGGMFSQGDEGAAVETAPPAAPPAEEPILAPFVESLDPTPVDETGPSDNEAEAQPRSSRRGRKE